MLVKLASNYKWKQDSKNGVAYLVTNGNFRDFVYIFKLLKKDEYIGKKL